MGKKGEQKYFISKEELDQFLKNKKIINEISNETSIPKYKIKYYLKLYDLKEYHRCVYCNSENVCNQFQNNKLVIFNICSSCKGLKISEGNNSRTYEEKKESRIKKQNTNLKLYGTKASFNNEKGKQTRLEINTIKKEETKKRELQKKGKKKPLKHEKYRNKEIFYKEYIKNNKSLYQLRSEWKCSVRVLLKYLHIHGFEERYNCINCGSSENLRERKGKNTFKYYSLCSICEHDRNSNIVTNTAIKKIDSKNISKEVLYDFHYNKFMPLYQIGKYLNISKKHVKRLFIKYNIEEILQCQICGDKNLNNLISLKDKKINLCGNCKSNLCYSRNSGSSVSKISQELFWKIYNNLSEDLKNYCYFAELNKEYTEIVIQEAKDFLEIKNYRYFYDFCISHPKVKLIIEFQGNIFHANPFIFNENDTPIPFNKELTSKDIWKNDEKKFDYLDSLGHYIVYVWEKDYKNNKDFWVDYCLIHINNLYNNLINIKGVVD